MKGQEGFFKRLFSGSSSSKSQKNVAEIERTRREKFVHSYSLTEKGESLHLFCDARSSNAPVKEGREVVPTSKSSVQKRATTITLLACLFVGANMMGGCSATSEKPSITQPVTQSMAYREPAPQHANPGSIYDAGTYRSLYEDGRARRVGDIVTINVMETSSASQTASTSTNRETDISGGISSLFGFQNIGIPGLHQVPIGGDLVGINSQNDFSGDGSTSRDNQISATLSARVINVLANGNMEIEAVREIKVNNETQFMVVSGLIRTRDITPSNTISSTQIANAKIEYYGQGVLTAKQKPGWLVRLLDFLAPF